LTLSLSAAGPESSTPVNIDHTKKRVGKTTTTMTMLMMKGAFSEILEAFLANRTQVTIELLARLSSVCLSVDPSVSRLSRMYCG